MRFPLALFVVVIALGALGGGAWWAFSDDAIMADAPMAALPIPPFPPRIAADPTYESCLALLPEDPAGALALITTWPNGAEPARHCQALALIADDRVAEGAALLETLGQAAALPPRARALVLDQAAEAWMQARAWDQAYRVIGQALALIPDDPDLLVRRARVAAINRLETEAIGDLTRVLRTNPDRADALLIRAMTWRQMDQMDRARVDIDRAAALAPDDAEILLERGIQRQQNGDLTGAREDWERVVNLDPDSEAADLAEQNLALLNAGPRQR